MNSCEKQCKNQKSEIRCQKSEVRSQKSEACPERSRRDRSSVLCPLFSVLCPLFSVFCPLVLSGCQLHTASVPKADCYYLNPDKDLCTIGRVAIVELDNDSPLPQISVDITEALFLALQKKQIFGLTMVRQDEPTWRSLQLDLDSTYSLEQLSAIRKTLKCDAVLVGTITQYKPYPHMAIGLRMMLLDLKDGQLLWAIEQVWDSADKTIESRIKNYLHSRMRSGLAPLREQLVVVSPLKFIKFVAYEVAETLQPER
ncbi:MAG: hypothetical protein ACE5NM_02420 [Sedimentisphaerales bacterium]